MATTDTMSDQDLFDQVNSERSTPRQVRAALEELVLRGKVTSEDADAVLSVDAEMGRA
jgi:hypothetical protein